MITNYLKLPQLKNTPVKICLLAFTLLFNLAVFAAPDPDPEGTEPSGDTVVPIDSNLYILLILGLVLAFYLFQKNKRKA